MLRCFHGLGAGKRVAGICSTHVEMFPNIYKIFDTVADLLHACGDVSLQSKGARTTFGSAPRMWRCFRPGAQGDERASICSTHVEMFLPAARRSLKQQNLLHACGDVSTPHSSYGISQASAPRMWRCFRFAGHPRRLHHICSTHVEMFPRPCLRPSSASNLLHACGDVSQLKSVEGPFGLSAPRMWGCFPQDGTGRQSALICSTHVEMLPRPKRVPMPTSHLLHACGDVSGAYFTKAMVSGSAPRMWRCFSSSLSLASISAICSTHVENFSIIFYHKSHLIAPRMWRCFLLYQRFIAQCFDCSTYVEIFSFLLGIWSQMTSSISNCLT